MANAGAMTWSGRLGLSSSLLQNTLWGAWRMHAADRCPHHFQLPSMSWHRELHQEDSTEKQHEHNNDFRRNGHEVYKEKYGGC